MKNSELKPCPFCGGEAELWASEYGTYAVWCNNSDCYMCSDTLDRTSKEAAIEAWNTRAKDIDVRTKERTCHMELRKQGIIYDVFYFDCCDKEYAENRNDRHASKISGDVCPYCGAKVVDK